jgi:TrmH family RNA methyltransferase
VTSPATKAELAALARLSRAGERRQTGLLLVEGPRLLHEALEAGLVPAMVVASERASTQHDALLLRAEAAGAELREADGQRIDRAADTSHGPGLLASVPMPTESGGQPEGAPGAGPVLELALAGLQDPGNVGTLVRAARGFGVDRVHLAGGTADPWGPKALRASAGAALHVPLSRDAAPEGLAQRAETHDLTLLVARAVEDGAAARALPERCLLVLGHETRGVPDLPGAATVAVPQRPELESLNVAMAGAILMAGWYAGHGTVS